MTRRMLNPVTGRPWAGMNPCDFGACPAPTQLSLFPEPDKCGTPDLFDSFDSFDSDTEGTT